MTSPLGAIRIRRQIIEAPTVPDDLDVRIIAEGAPQELERQKLSTPDNYLIHLGTGIIDRVWSMVNGPSSLVHGLVIVHKLDGMEHAQTAG
jgi:hypothetical protein